MSGTRLMREQVRARLAYKVVDELRDLKAAEIDNYRTLARGFGTAVQQSGLVGALAFVERYHDKKASERLRGHLAEQLGEAGIPGFTGDVGRDLAERVCNLDIDAYMLATREVLRIAIWLRRAVDSEQ